MRGCEFNLPAMSLKVTEPGLWPDKICTLLDPLLAQTHQMDFVLVGW